MSDSETKASRLAAMLAAPIEHSTVIGDNAVWVDDHGHIMIMDNNDKQSVRFSVDDAKLLHQWLEEVLRGK